MCYSKFTISHIHVRLYQKVGRNPIEDADDLVSGDFEYEPQLLRFDFDTTKTASIYRKFEKSGYIEIVTTQDNMTCIKLTRTGEEKCKQDISKGSNIEIPSNRFRFNC